MSTLSLVIENALSICQRIGYSKASIPQDSDLALADRVLDLGTAFTQEDEPVKCLFDIVSLCARVLKKDLLPEQALEEIGLLIPSYKSAYAQCLDSDLLINVFSFIYEQRLSGFKSTLQQISRENYTLATDLERAERELNLQGYTFDSFMEKWQKILPLKQSLFAARGLSCHEAEAAEHNEDQPCFVPCTTS